MSDKSTKNYKILEIPYTELELLKLKAVIDMIISEFSENKTIHGAYFIEDLQPLARFNFHITEALIYDDPTNRSGKEEKDE